MGPSSETVYIGGMLRIPFLLGPFQGPAHVSKLFVANVGVLADFRVSNKSIFEHPACDFLLHRVS